MKLNLLLLFLSVVIGSNAQKQIHVSGTVFEGSKPLDDVNIFFIHKSDTLLETRSDSGGKYEFTATMTENEKYEISVPADGYIAPREIIWIEDKWTGPFVIDIHVIRTNRGKF